MALSDKAKAELLSRLIALYPRHDRTLKKYSNTMLQDCEAQGRMPWRTQVEANVERETRRRAHLAAAPSPRKEW